MYILYTESERAERDSMRFPRGGYKLSSLSKRAEESERRGMRFGNVSPDLSKARSRVGLWQPGILLRNLFRKFKRVILHFARPAAISGYGVSKECPRR